MSQGLPDGPTAAPTERLPLFVLDTVLFPGVVLPLHVFEPRYRQLMTHLLDRSEPREFGVLGVRRTGNAEDVVGQLQPVGCIAQLRRFKQHEDGTSDIVVVGTDRFRLDGLADTPDLYWVADAERFPTESDADPFLPDTQVVAKVARLLIAAYLREMARLRDKPDMHIEADDLTQGPTALSWLIASATVLTRADAQRLLEIDSALARLRAEITLLRQEIGMLSHFRSLPVSPFELGAEPGEN